MKNIFVQLKASSGLKREAIEKLVEIEKNENMVLIVDKFYDQANQQAENCSKLLRSLLQLAKNTEVREKLLSLMVYFTSRLPRQAALASITFVSSCEHQIASKVRFFSHVYKSTEDEELKKKLLQSTVEIISLEPKLSLFSSFVENFDVLISRLSFNPQQFTQLYLKLINYLQKHIVYKQLWPRYVVKCLSCVTEVNVHSPEVDQLLLKLVREPHLIEKASILLRHQFLRKNKYFQFLEALLLGDYEIIHISLLEEKQISVDEWRKRVKISSIPRVFAGIKVASYTQVAQILGIPKALVEEYIIEAIKEGILKAKIDQFQQSIIINHVKLRCLREEDEAKIQKDLSAICARFEELCAN